MSGDMKVDKTNALEHNPTTRAKRVETVGTSIVNSQLYGRDVDSGAWVNIGAKELANAAGYFGLVIDADMTLDGDVYVENLKLISTDNTPGNTFYLKAYDMDSGAGTDYAQAMAIGVPGAGGIIVIDLGREAAANSLPFSIDNESFALLGTIAGDTTSLDAKTPDWSTAAVGQKAMAASVPVTMADNQTPIPVILGSDPVRVTFTSGAAPISQTTAIAGSNWRPLYFTVTVVAPVTSEDFTCTLDSDEGANYDSVEYRQDLTTPAATDITVPFSSNFKMLDGDQLLWEYPNTDGRTFYISLVYEVC